MSLGKIEKKQFNEKWNALIKSGQALIFHKGQALFYEGHFPYGVYWVRQGDVRFTHRGRCVEKHDKQSAKTTQGRWLGFSELALSRVHCCTCEAVSDCEVIFVNRNQFLSLLPSLESK